MIIEKVVHGRLLRVRAKTLGGNAYIIKNKDHLIIIDSLLLPEDSRELAEIARSSKLPVKYLINTHYHSDHCLGNRYLKQEDTLQINHKSYWQTIEREKAMIKPGKYKPVDKKRLTTADITFEQEYLLEDIRIIHTPGHSPDSSSLYLSREKYLISGDTLLSNYAHDAYSLPYFFWGSIDDLFASIKKLLSLEIDLVFSGHGAPLEGKPKMISDLNYLHRIKDVAQKYKSTVKDAYELAQMVPAEKILGTKQRVAVPRVHELNLRKLLCDDENEKLDFSKTAANRDLSAAAK